MKIHASFRKYTLQFKFDAGTSRGIMKTRDTWYIHLQDLDNPLVAGVGEAAPIEGLSREHLSLMDEKLYEICQRINGGKVDLSGIHDLPFFPSIAFALEVAFLDLQNGGGKLLFKNDFSSGKALLPINGLVWMGKEDFMMEQVVSKIEEGYRCIKLKIGALDFEQELNLVSFIRKNFKEKDLTIRVDANGAFSTKEALEKLDRLAPYQVHSIEQPIRQGQQDAMKALCKESPIPIALDEELISFYTLDEKKKLLEYIQPQYLILKPTLVGGFKHAGEWIALSDEIGAGWWITSALESNIGLNAISQWTAEYQVQIPQGLGTGQLFHNNIESPLYINKGYLGIDPTIAWGDII